MSSIAPLDLVAPLSPPPARGDHPRVVGADGDLARHSEAELIAQVLAGPEPAG